MSNEIPVTIVGFVGGDPTLRFLPSGKAVASFNLAQSNRIKDGETWKDGETTWFSVTAWEQMAENVVESLHKGDSVIVQGGMYTRKYTTDSREERSVLEIRAEAIGPNLRRATAIVTKVASSSGGAPVTRSNSVDDRWASSTEPPF